MVLGSLVILTLVFLAFRPILPGNFLMDDHRLLHDENPLVTGQIQLRDIWFCADFTLSTVGLWLEWLAFGENPNGYHLVNILLHAASAILLWRLLARLKVPGAWLAAAIFAVHPVCVNSVARIAEIKNTLSLPFFILSALFYARHDNFASAAGDGEHKKWRPWKHAAFWYGLSLISFVLALMSKTSTVMLPFVLLGIAWWRRQRLGREDVWHTAPFFILSLAFGLMSVWYQKNQALAGAGITLEPESFAQRVAVAGQVAWFYLGKAVLPLNLNLVYPRSTIDPAQWTAYLPVAGFAAALALGWRFRRSWGVFVLFGLGCFLINLFPVLGFFDSQFLATWQVSDHLQYLPLLAPVTAVAALIAVALGRWKNQWVFPAAAMTVIAVLLALTCRQAGVFAGEEALFRDTLRKNPAAAEVHNDFAVILIKQGKYDEATEHFFESVRLDPGNAGARLNLGKALDLHHRYRESEPCYQAAARLKPESAEVRRSYGLSLWQQDRYREAAVQMTVALCLKPQIETRLDLAALLRKSGDYAGAASQFRKALFMDSNLAEASNNLAWLLATCPDGAVRNGDQAILLAQRACRQTGFKQTAMISTLAAAYAEAGRYPEAISTAEAAITKQHSNGETRYAAINEQLLTLYRAGAPYHEPTPSGR